MTISGYYEPEWDERTAFEDLQKQVMWESQPASMTPGDWDRTRRITGVKPITAEEVEEWFHEDEMEAEAFQFGVEVAPP